MKTRVTLQGTEVTIETGKGQFEELLVDTRGFRELSNILKDATGIHLVDSSKNRSLMASRLNSILRRRGLAGYGVYLKMLLAANNPGILSEFVSALTTNTTQFFREAPHFGQLKDILPSILAGKAASDSRELRVWCAAASSGQEPYSILITLLESIDPALYWQLKFLGTDIDADVLARAIGGKYSESEVESLPALYRQKYMLAHKTRAATTYEIRREIREKIRFAQLNLIEAFPFQYKFDVIFCRNVLIYFDSKTGREVVDRLIAALAPGGVLFLGHSESGTMKPGMLPSFAHAAYRKLPGKGTNR